MLFVTSLHQVTKLLKKKRQNVMYTFRSAFPLSEMAVYIFDTACECSEPCHNLRLALA